MNKYIILLFLSFISINYYSQTYVSNTYTMCIKSTNEFCDELDTISNTNIIISIDENLKTLSFNYNGVVICYNLNYIEQSNMFNKYYCTDLTNQTILNIINYDTTILTTIYHSFNDDIIIYEFKLNIK